MKKLFYIIILSVLLLQACKHKPEKLIPEPTYKQILKEIILAGLIQEKFPKKDSPKNDAIYLVYKKYGIDSLTLKKTTDYYSQHPEKLAVIYKDIYNDLKQKADSLNKLLPQQKHEKDKVIINKDFLFSKKHKKKQK